MARWPWFCDFVQRLDVLNTLDDMLKRDYDSEPRFASFAIMVVIFFFFLNTSLFILFIFIF